MRGRPCLRWDSRNTGRAPGSWTALAAVACAVLLYASVLFGYWSAYFPYEDDFALLVHSTRLSSTPAHEWWTKGYSDYFDNGQPCTVQAWGYARPLVNLSFYFESLFFRGENYYVFLLTNIAAFAVAVWLFFRLAGILGLGNRLSFLLAISFAVSPVWHRALLHSSFRTNSLCSLFLLLGIYFMLPVALRSASHPRRRQTATGLCSAAAILCHEQGYFMLPLWLVLLWFGVRHLGLRSALRELPAGMLRLFGPTAMLLFLLIALNPSYGRSYASASVAGAGVAHLLTVGLIRSPFLFTPLDLRYLHDLAPVLLLLLAVGNLAILAVLLRVVFLGARKDVPILISASTFLLALLPVLFYGVAERRFLVVAAAFGLLLLGTLLNSCSKAHGAAFWAVACCLGFAAGFGVIVFGVEVASKKTVLESRSQADRTTFLRMAAELARNPSAKVVFLNDQSGTWAAAAMLKWAGQTQRRVLILPSNFDRVRSVSYDFGIQKPQCLTSVYWKEQQGTLLFQLENQSPHCAFTSFASDLQCTCEMFARHGLPGNCLYEEHTLFPGKPRRAVAFARHLSSSMILTGDPVLIVSWSRRNSPAEVTVVAPAETASILRTLPASGRSPSAKGGYQP